MTSIGSLVTQMYDAADAAQAAYEVTEGEETPETQAAEAMWLGHADNALESLAAFRLNLDGSAAALTAEKRRIEAALKRVKGATAWCESKTLDVMERIGVRSKTLGAFQIRVRTGRERVVLKDGFRVEDVPEHYLRCQPATVELDKSLAKRAIQAGEEIAGVAVEYGPDTVKIR